MKIAIIHDVVEEWGGANKFLCELLKIFPNSDLYTLYFDNYDSNNKGIKDLTGKVVTNKLINFWKKLRLPYFRSLMLLISPYFWEKLDMSGYDFVISSTYGYGSYGVIVPPQTKHLCYCHTPSKRLYGERRQMIMRGGKKQFFNLSWLYCRRRLWDFVAAQRPDVWWSNSKYTQMRIKRIFRRESEVVYVPMKSFKGVVGKHNGYYLYFGRLVLDKGLEMIIEAFNDNKKKLLIVGRGEKKDEKYLKKIANNNINFCGFIEDKKMSDIFSSAKALIFAAKNEDFGMVMVEAMSAGVPVIAYSAGGAVEIIENEKTGVLFQEYDKRALNEAINKFEKTKIKSAVCIRRAKYFINNGFRMKILTLVDDLFKE